MLTGLKGERGQDVFEILRRISFHGRGFESCYMATTDTGEVCHMAWLLSASHNGLIASQYPPGTSKLKEDEALLENIFTFPRYRGKGVMTAVTAELANLAREQGFRRLVAYVDVENKTSLRAFHRAGFHPCGEETEQWRFFRNKRSGHGGR